METSNGIGKTIGALILGAAIGGAMGILFAPDKGSRTRRRLMDKGEDLTDSMKEKFNDFLEDVKDKAKGYMPNGTKNEKHKVA